MAYEPHRLAAASLGLAALDSEPRAHFELAHQPFQVVEHVVAPDDPFRGRLLSEVETPRMRVLWRGQAGEQARAPIALRRDPPTTAIAAGDRLFFLSLKTPGEADLSGDEEPSLAALARQAARRLAFGLRERGFRPTSQGGRVAIGGLTAIAALLLLAILLFQHAQPATGLGETLRTSLLILLSNGHLADGKILPVLV